MVVDGSRLPRISSTEYPIRVMGEGDAGSGGKGGYVGAVGGAVGIVGGTVVGDKVFGGDVEVITCNTSAGAGSPATCFGLTALGVGQGRG